MTRTRSLLLACLLALAGPAAAAAAESEADALVVKGIELRRKGDPAKALELFEKAYSLSPSGRVLVHRALAEASLHKWVDAERHLGDALARPDSPWLANKVNRDMIEKTLSDVRQHIGSIRVEGTDGAEITLDGQPVGRLPLATSLRAPEGKVRVAARAAGRRSSSADVTVVAKAEAVVRFDLQAEPSAASAGASAPGGGPPVVPPPPAVAPPVAPPVTPSPSAGDGGKLRRQLAWGSAIVAGASFAGAIVETVVWQHKRGQFNDSSRDCYQDLPMRGGAGCSALWDDAHSAQTIALVGYGLAAALGTTSVVLFLSGRPDADGPRVACAPALPSTMLSCRLTF